LSGLAGGSSVDPLLRSPTEAVILGADDRLVTERSWLLGVQRTGLEIEVVGWPESGSVCGIKQWLSTLHGFLGAFEEWDKALQ